MTVLFSLTLFGLFLFIVASGWDSALRLQARRFFWGTSAVVLLIAALSVSSLFLAYRPGTVGWRFQAEFQSWPLLKKALFLIGKPNLESALEIVLVYSPALAVWMLGALALRAEQAWRVRWRLGALSLLSVGLCLGGLEAWLRLSPPRSDGSMLSNEGERWFARYWRPVNRLGYRDYEHSPNEFRRRKVLLIVGDSFAAGHGIDSIVDRFGDRLQRRLGTGWSVVNVAKSGWDTPQEFDALRRYPARPQVVVLSYFMNDIGYTCHEEGRDWDGYKRRPGWVTRIVLRNLDIADALYWRLYRLRGGYGGTQSFLSYLENCYRDPAVWARHQRDLLELAHWVRRQHAKPVVLVFPALEQVSKSRPYTDQVALLFRHEGVPCLNLGPLLEGRPVRELIVNSCDAHPSVSLNHEVADRLYPLVTE